MRKSDCLVLVGSVVLAIPGTVLATANPVPVPTTVQYLANGMPILNSNSGAAGAAFIDFDGGYWGSASTPNMTAYDLDGNPTSFNAAEAEDI